MIDLLQLNYLRRLREQHELRAEAAQRARNEIRHLTAKTADSSTNSTLNLLSQSTNGNKTIKSYSDLSKNACSIHTSDTSLDNPITVTTLNKLQEEINYLELCHST